MQQENLYRNSQLADLIQQSFDVFNVYGKEPEAATNIIMGFKIVLEPYRIDDITAAFVQYMGTAKVMPVPAQIKEIVIEIQAERARKSNHQGKVVNLPRNPKLMIEHAPNPWHGTKRADWGDETLKQFIEAHKHYQPFVLKSLLPIYGWDIEGFEDAVAISKNPRV